MSQQPWDPAPSLPPDQDPLRVVQTDGEAVQKPVSTPKRVKVIFSTRVGRNITVPGDHYTKIENLAGAEVEHTLK